MGGCEKADLSQKVVCCPAKIHIFVLAGIMFVSAVATAGLFYWQIDQKVPENPNQNKDWWYLLMVIPGLMLLTGMCLVAMLKINMKVLLCICIAWPILSSIGPGVLIWVTFLFFEEMQKELDAKGTMNVIDAQEFYIAYIAPVSAVLYILCAMYCAFLLVCLSCCGGRGGGGREEDLYDVEDGENEEIGTCSDSHISIE